MDDNNKTKEELTKELAEMRHRIAELERSEVEYKLAEDGLRESERRLLDIIQFFPDPTVVIDFEGKVVAWNRAIEDLTGVKAEEMLGKGNYEYALPFYGERRPILIDLVKEPDEDIERKYVNIECRGGTLFGESYMPSLRGGTVYLYGTATALRNSKGEVIGAIESIRDITERKSMEESLKKSQELLGLAIEGSGVGLWDWKIQTGEASFNERWAQIIGYTLKGLKPVSIDTWIRFAHPDDLKRSDELLQKHFAGEIPYYECEARMRHKSGDWIWVLGRGKVVEWDMEGKPVRMTGTHLDITERKRAEEALRESQQRLSDIINFLPDATFAIDREGKVIAWNRAIEEMSGVRAEEMLGKGNYEHSLPFYGTRRPILIDLVFKSVQEIREKYHSVEKEGDVLIAEADVPVRGRVRALWGKASPLYDSKGNIAGAIESIRDVTERKNLKAQFFQSQKMEAIGALASGIAHDLNNLLTGIRMHAYLGRGNLEEGDPAFIKLKNIEDIVDSAANLTKQFLGFARGGKYEVKPTDLNDIIDRTVTFFNRTKKEITIHREYQEAIWTVDADQGQMEQVLLNLLVNAQHAMPGGGDIRIRTENITLDETNSGPYLAGPGRYVKISVTDNGTGIDEKIKGRIFDPFFTTKERGIGTGLGLASVYGIVKNHEGHITVESEVGKGSTFGIFLPATDKKAVRGGPARAKLRTGTETILLVDDEKEILNVTMAIFEALGYRVYGAQDGRQAVETYKTHRDDIAAVVLDFIMPGMDGEETYDKLKEINPDVRVILASGYSMNEKIQRTMQKGCRVFVQKPYDIRALSIKIREVLDS